MSGTEQMAVEQTLVDRGHDAALDANRFGFGENWRQFLALLNDDRIGEAERSMQDLLEMPSLDGRRFLDIGSGSGLFSLAARLSSASIAANTCTHERRPAKDDAV